MRLQDFNKILIIISTSSKNYKKVNNLIENEFSKIGTNYEIRLTKDKDSNKEFTKDFILSNTNSLIIAVGGDGSISEVSNQIFESKREDIYFSFLPNGTGNDFSRTIYGKQKLEDIIKNLSNIKLQKIDLIKINDLTSINVAGFGFESIVLVKSLMIKERFPLFSKLSFVLGIFLALGSLKPIRYDYEFIIDGGEKIVGNSSTIMNSLCNGKYYGGGFLPAPNALIDDGIIHMNTIDYVSPIRLISLINKYKSSKHLSIKESKTIKVKSGIIKSLDGAILANIDGNPFTFKTLEFEILEKSLNLITFKKE